MEKRRELFMWHPVFNLLMRIKDMYVEEYGTNNNNFEHWLATLDREEGSELGKSPLYEEIRLFDNLETRQSGDLLIIRYGMAELSQKEVKELWEDNNKELYKESRSIVIDLKNEEIVILPFKKFFNLNEVEENSLENITNIINNSRLKVEVTNKLDGSMQCLRWYNDKLIHTGSRSLGDNSWRIEDCKERFIDERYISMAKDYSNFTFIFEYISLKDAHVVKYNNEQEGLYLIGMRNVYSGEEKSNDYIRRVAERYNIPCCEKENISLNQMLEQMKVLKSCDKEGWVMNFVYDDEDLEKDKVVHRVKVKCDDYVHLHRLLSKVSSINVLIEAVAEDRVDDLLSKVPDNHKESLLPIIDKLQGYCKLYNYIVEYYVNLYKDNLTEDADMSKTQEEDRKEKMLWVNNNVSNLVQSAVRRVICGQPYDNPLKNSGGYKKMSEIEDKLKKLIILFKLIKIEEKAKEKRI